MRIFAIRDANDRSERDLAYLLYYEGDKRFYIELPEDADPWETPLLLSSFAEKGERSINSYWSKIWVQQRIVPTDRQNIVQILRDNGLKEYDEYDLLMLASGRCEQDDYYLVPIDENVLPQEVIQRFEKKIEDVVVLNNNCLLVFFRDGKVRKCDLNDHFKSNRKFSILEGRPDLFSRVRMQTGGHGVQWDDNLTIPDHVLYSMGEMIPLCADDFRSFASERVINAAEAAEILKCSRQYVNELVKTEKLHPIKTSPKNTLFLKSEVEKRNWI
ncbi:MAG: helix-turn-helix domain-containing protein [Oscillospiraceae bacterium]|nr:helix-turn-helix domain-containing protein [Oscillospiraceae bacterium]